MHSMIWEYGMEEITSREETVTSTNGEDQLLIQIDAFRDKARLLQSLIKSKETRVKELEYQVYELERKNIELSDSLARKQEEADSIVSDVNEQVDRMMQDVKANMSSLEERIERQVTNNEDAAAEQTKAMQDTLSNMSQGLEGIKLELAEKVHTENVKVYRNIQDLLKELDKSEEQKAELEHKLSDIKTTNSAALIFTLVNILLSTCVGLLLLLSLGVF